MYLANRVRSKSGPEAHAVQRRLVVAEIPARCGARDRAPAAVVPVAVRGHERGHLEVRRDAVEARRVGVPLGDAIGVDRGGELLGRHRGEAEHAETRAGGAGEGGLARRRDPERGMWLLDRLRHELPLRDLVVTALVPREGVVDEEAADHPERLVPHLAGLVDRDAERLGVVPGCAPARAEVHAPVGQNVERGRALGDPDRVIAGEDDHAVPQPDARRPRREGRQEDLGGGAMGDLLVEVMLGRPVVVEADLLGEDGLGQRVPVDSMVHILAGRPGLRRLHLGDQSELHGGPAGSSHGRGLV